MKIKTDFVTNSSSTCYIIVLPPDMKKIDEIIENFDYKNNYSVNELLAEKICKENNIKEFVKKSVLRGKEQGYLHQDSEEYLLISLISDMFAKYSIHDYAGGPDNFEITFLDIEKVKQVIEQ